jgi:hypothetical protein
VRAGVVVRHGALISTSNFATRPRPRSSRRVPSDVAVSTTKNGDSHPVEDKGRGPDNLQQSVEPELVGGNAILRGCAQDAKSVLATAAEISKAASALARLPRRRKRWSGVLNGRRITRLTPVIVPNGKVYPAYVVRRGFVLVLLPESEDGIFARFRAKDVRVYRSPLASLLGRQPPRPGRRRGRPRKAASQTPCPPATVARAST